MTLPKSTAENNGLSASWCGSHTGACAHQRCATVILPAQQQQQRQHSNSNNDNTDIFNRATPTSTAKPTRTQRQQHRGGQRHWEAVQHRGEVSATLMMGISEGTKQCSAILESNKSTIEHDRSNVRFVFEAPLESGPTDQERAERGHDGLERPNNALAVMLQRNTTHRAVLRHDVNKTQQGRRQKWSA